jgi:hypothetical protein
MASSAGPAKDTRPSPKPRSATKPGTKTETEPAGTKPKRRLDQPIASVARLAQRTWWMPWVLGAAVVAVGAVTAIQVFDSSPAPTGWSQVQLPSSTHDVVYEVTGKGKAPEIKYVIDGVNGSETVTNADLPWRKEFRLKVGPGLGVVQVAAANSNQAEGISCSVRVDGNILHQATGPGEGSTVSCSSVIRPN